jgi:hypothetical protein
MILLVQPRLFVMFQLLIFRRTARVKTNNIQARMAFAMNRRDVPGRRAAKSLGQRLGQHRTRFELASAPEPFGAYSSEVPERPIMVACKT